MVDLEVDPRITSTDSAVGEWRQGDCVLGEHWFAHRLDVLFSVTDSGMNAAQDGADLAEQVVPGFVVVTQTCDIVRTCGQRPYIEVCPLVEVAADRLVEIQRGRRPAYAFVPRLSDKRLVADLDRVMTVEKPLVATWERTAGWTADVEARAFAQALSRKRVRFAFPDDFTELVTRLLTRLTDKHGKNTDEGRGLRALDEIRVYASPSWDANEVMIFLWFVRNDHDVCFEGKSWADLHNAWLNLLSITGRFKSVEGQVVTLKDMTAEEYVTSDPLDLDHLSTASL